MAPTSVTSLVALLPASRGKNRLLNACGHRVHPRAHLGPVLALGVGQFVLGDRARLGALTVLRGVRSVELGPGATVGPSNWISSSPIPSASGDLAGRLILGTGATISTRHRLDCSGGIVLGPGAAIAGWETLVMTHDLDPATGELVAAGVEIGAHSFVHAANKIAAGTRIPEDVRTEIGTVLGPAPRSAGSRWAGNPAAEIGPFARVRPERAVSVVHVLPTVDDSYGGPGPVLAAWLELDSQSSSARIFATVNHRGALAERLDKLAETDFCPPGAALGRFYGNAAQLRRVARAAASADVVVSHSFFHLPALVAGWSARRHGAAWVVAPHGSLDPWDVRQHHEKIKRALGWVWRRALTSASVWCVTQREADEVETFGAQPTTAVIACPIGADTPLDRDSALSVLGELGPILGGTLDRGGQIVSFVGRFDVKKGLERLVTAFDVAATDDDVLVLAGGGDDVWEQRVRQAVASARRGNQIVLPGWLDPAGKRALWSLPGVFALTSDNENFGVAVAEAMSAAVPVLITDRVALADLVTSAQAGVVCTTAHEDVVRGLQRLLGDRDSAAQLGRRGAAAVRAELSPSHVAHQYQDAMAAAIASTRMSDTTPAHLRRHEGH